MDEEMITNQESVVASGGDGQPVEESDSPVKKAYCLTRFICSEAEEST